MNEIVLSKDNWLNEVEAIITGYSFNKIDDNTREIIITER